MIAAHACICVVDVDLAPTIYAVAAIVLLPINSAFNPLLYSDVPEYIWKKCFATTRCGVWTEKRFFTCMASAGSNERQINSTAGNE